MSILLEIKRRRFLKGLVIAITIGAVFCLAFNLDLLFNLQLQSSDFLFQAANQQERIESDGEIVVVGIDEKSLETLGRFSQWPRSYYAQLIDSLAEAEARVVAFDILFAEPTAEDGQLAASIKNAGNVVLPVMHTPTSGYSTVMPEPFQPGAFLRPLEYLGEPAAALGHANVAPDADGVVRRLSIAIRNGNEYEPALSLVTVAEYLRLAEPIQSPIKDNVLSFAGRFIPLGDNNEMLINYIGSPKESGQAVNFPIVSFADVINGNMEPAVFEDKIVIVGATASGIGDTFWTPMGQMMNGVEIHATAIHTILAGNFLRQASSAVTIVSILVLALLCGLAVLRFSVRWATLLAFFLGILYFITAFSVFDNGIILNMLYPPLAIAGTFLGVNLYNVATERSEKRELTKTFGRYVSPSVVDKIMVALGKGELKLGGEEQEITVLFADARGFTSLSEQIPPGELVLALNAYLSKIIDAVLKHDGMINKFGGDSIMAVWNVPIGTENHALSATRAAIYAQQAINDVQKQETALPRMEFGIGINTGLAVAGNMGSEDRLEYSVVGDTVNTAARLADAAAGGKIWVGIDTFSAVKDYITAKPLDPLVVKGKREPIEAYEVVGIDNISSDQPQRKI